MYPKYWEVTRNEGTQCLEHDGYFIPITKLIERPVFWTDHVAGNIWGTEPAVQELTAFAAGASAQRKLDVTGLLSAASARSRRVGALLGSVRRRSQDASTLILALALFSGKAKSGEARNLTPPPY